MKHTFYKTIKGRFLLISAAIMLLVGIGTSTLAYIMFSRNLKDSQIHSAETSLQILKNLIDSDVQDIMTLSRQTRTNSKILDFINTDRDSTSYNTITRNASEWLNEQCLSNNARQYIDRVVIANMDRTDFLQVVPSGYSVGKPMVQIIQELPYYEELMELPDYSFHIGVQNDPFLTKSVRMLPVIQPVYSSFGNTVVGFSYMQISFELFRTPLAQYSHQTRMPVYLQVSDSIWEISGNAVIPLSPKYLPGKASGETSGEASGETSWKASEDASGETSGKASGDASGETSRAALGGASGKASENAAGIKTVRYNAAPDSDIQVRSVHSDGKEHIYVTVALDSRDCSISIPLPDNALYQQSRGYLAILFLILLCVLVIGGFLILSLNRTVTRPVALLQGRIDAVARENFEPDSSVEWDNELGDIGRNINRMASDIQTLMKQKIQFETQKKDYEYQVLQSQINPHFLYNTLNSIKWMATIQHAPGIAEMTTSLAHLLKSIAKGTTTMVTLEDEISLLNEYFTIQKYRYGGAITLEYQIDDDDLLKARVLRFTLQPLVENAIFHGIEPKGQSGRIRVHVYPEGADGLLIDVTDDGVGMDEEAIRRVLNGAPAEKTHFFRQIGIGTVNQRIRYSFGMEYGLTITSVPGQYTTMSVHLPYRIENV